MGRSRRFSNEDVEALRSDYLRLGTLKAVADLWGTTPGTVSRTFQRANISIRGFRRSTGGPDVVCPTCRRAAGEAGDRPETLRTHPKLGVWSDARVGVVFGVTRQRVHQIRRELGIPSARQRRHDDITINQETETCV